ncbi:GNAT family N-acetyltransferase [Actinokineospora guangxiensis]|uniref:GNAT family N-acetyltransferase n=1 Tax=Actinokineospora guangxiensis TaxID=1490288 RepID=A0ABW0ESN4_9PSEU
MRIREGGVADAPIVLGLLDEAVEWMVARGQTEQWGTEPWSAQPKRVARIEGLAAEGLWVGEVDGEAVGALVLGGPPPTWIPPVDEPEVYLQLLVTSRRHQGTRVGARMLEFAREQAWESGVSLLRVDCWAGGGGRLVDYYTGQGFTPTETFSVNGWPGQVLEMRR